MDDGDFEYEVAFSFTYRDEGLASQLNDLLSDRMKTFIYFEQQKKLAGTDGQASFSNVYGNTSRVAVILFRKEWGETPWTRVEADAIKGRSLRDGWDFTLFIAVEEKPSIPPWLPPTRLYLALPRFGIDGAAGAIEQRVAERGGAPKIETIVERAARHKRAMELTEARRVFQSSEAGVNAAKAAYEDYSVAIEAACDAVRGSVKLQPRRSQEYRLVNCGNFNLVVDWRPHYANSLDQAVLEARIYRGLPPIPGFTVWREAQQFRLLRYVYELAGFGRHAYVAVDEGRRELTPTQLADHLLQALINVVEKTID